MAWALAIFLIVLVIVAGSAIVLVIRNNQLSLARDLCLEALRQVNVQREQRHALVPEFVSLARACRGNSSVDVGDGSAIGSTAERDVACRELSSALTRAVSVGTEEPATPGDTTASVGPAEDQLTSAGFFAHANQPVRRPLTLPHLDEAAHQGAHHVVAECVGA